MGYLNNIKYMFVNARSFPNKNSKLQITEQDHDLVIETWFDDSFGSVTRILENGNC